MNTRRARLLALAWALCAGVAYGQETVFSKNARAEFEARLSAGATPLDSLTPFGQREFIRSLHWGERGLGGFSLRMPERELLPEQVRALLGFVGAQAYVPARLASTPPLRFPAPQAQLEQAWLDFQALSAREAERQSQQRLHLSTFGSGALKAYYRASFAPFLQASALSAASLGDLALLFDASALMAHDQADVEAMQDQARVYDELQKRAVDTRRGFDRAMLRRLLSTHEFDAARAFVRHHPDLADTNIPDISDTLGAAFKGRTVLDVQGAAWQRNPVAAPRGTQIIAVIGTACHFARDALRDIEADPVLLTELKRANLLLLVSPTEAMPYDFVRNWNASHAALPIRIAARSDEWRDLDFYHSPQFHVFHDGVLRSVITGWPPAGNKEALRAALAAVQ